MHTTWETLKHSHHTTHHHRFKTTMNGESNLTCWVLTENIAWLVREPIWMMVMHSFKWWTSLTHLLPLRFWLNRGVYDSTCSSASGSSSEGKPYWGSKYGLSYSCFLLAGSARPASAGGLRNGWLPSPETGFCKAAPADASISGTSPGSWKMSRFVRVIDD